MPLILRSTIKTLMLFSEMVSASESNFKEREKRLLGLIDGLERRINGLESCQKVPTEQRPMPLKFRFDERYFLGPKWVAE